MDGVAAVSQAPIVPGGQFRYIFKATPSGTHWYLGSQRTDGLFGALIVHESDKEHQDIIADVSEDLATWKSKIYGFARNAHNYTA